MGGKLLVKDRSGQCFLSGAENTRRPKKSKAKQEQHQDEQSESQSPYRGRQSKVNLIDPQYIYITYILNDIALCLLQS